MAWELGDPHTTPTKSFYHFVIRAVNRDVEIGDLKVKIMSISSHLSRLRPPKSMATRTTNKHIFIRHYKSMATRTTNNVNIVCKRIIGIFTSLRSVL